MATSVESAPVWARGLNAQQRRAVDHDGGPLRIIAGAGTGKTRTLVSRLARLLQEGVLPERVLLVTFSRRAASELIRRAGQLVEPRMAKRVEAGTFHSIAHRILRRYSSSLGLPEGFTVMDQGDVVDLFALLRTPIAADRHRRFPKASTVAAVYARVVSSQLSVEETVAHDFPWCAEDIDGLKSIFTGYTERKRAQQLLDFDDLLLFWRAAAMDPNVGPVLASMFDHVLVDEYQDTSIVQADVLRALRSLDARITVVGDDAQAIYSFRAASVRNILDFPDHFPGATTVTLEHNYRSTAPILELANAVIAEANEGHGKRLWTDQSGGVRPSWPRAKTSSVRPRRCAGRSSSTTSRASRSRIRSCCSEPRTTATSSRSSLGGGAFPSSSTGGSDSWRHRTFAICSRGCDYWRTRGTSWPGCGCSSWRTASAPSRPAG